MSSLAALTFAALLRSALAGDVVKVKVSDCPGQPAVALSGFAVGKGDRVVTALHGVVGASCRIRLANDAQVHVPAKVIAVDRRHDLALLAGESIPLSYVPYSKLGKLSAVQAGGVLRAIGYPLDVPKAIETVMRARGGRLVELWSLLPPLPRGQLEARSSPALDANVLSLQGSLAPGYSGAPILAEDGTVVGVANGGLASGATEITWAVDAGVAASLRDGANDGVSAVFAALGSSMTKPVLFADAYEEEPRPGFSCFGRRFAFLRRLSLEDLAQDADDRATLESLVAAYNVEGIRVGFDLFSSEEGEIRLVVPVGWGVEKDGYDCRVRPANKGSKVRVDFELHPVAGDQFSTEVEELAIMAESTLCNEGFEVNPWFGNPQARVNNVSGVMTRRRGFARTDARCGGPGLLPDSIGTYQWSALSKPLADPLAQSMGSTCGRWVCPPDAPLLFPGAWNSPYLSEAQREEIVGLSTGDAFLSLAATRSALLVGVAREVRSSALTVQYQRCQREMDRSPACMEAIGRYIDYATATIVVTASSLRSDQVGG